MKAPTKEYKNHKDSKINMLNSELNTKYEMKRGSSINIIKK